MKTYLFVLISLWSSICLISQENIPASIQGELTLKPNAKPYESSGFTVEKGATLTILPGTKIKLSSGADKYCNIVIKGSIIIGSKESPKSKPVIFDGYSPWVKFIGANIDITNLQITLVNCQFQGENSGTIRNSFFYRDQKSIPYPFIVHVPSKGNLTITECLIEDQGIDIKTNNFPSDLPNFTLSKCAFTYTPLQNKDSFFYKKCAVNIYAFAYGNQCDTYSSINFTKFDWQLTEPLLREWHVSDASLSKTLQESAKDVKNYTLKLEKKTFTAHKQAPEPAPKKNEKK